MRNGRPLRFLALVLGGWTVIRISILWPVVNQAATVLGSVAASPAEAADAPPLPSPTARPSESRIQSEQYVVRRRGVPPLSAAPAAFGGSTVDWTMPRQSAGDSPHPPLRAVEPVLAAGLPAASSVKRWSASLWLVARRGSGAGRGFTGPQLGGSQAGVRIAYLLDRRHRLAIAARIASPLGAGQRDAAIGIEWQPTRWPIRVVAEQRFTLGPGRGGPTIGAIGGFGPSAIGSGFRLEGYGQAGYIARRNGEGFADGALRLSHPLVSIGRVKLDLGAATWGAAQKGAARVDVGPSLGLTLPVARCPIRLSLEWRERVAGNAQPVSGPALTLGADF